MDAIQIQTVGRGIERFLAEFSDCFGRCDTESYLAVYVRGQNSGLQRKSVEPMALQAGIAPEPFFPYRAPGDHRPRYPVESLSVNQVREAVAAWFQAAALPRSARKPILEKAARTISYERHHNATAMQFHRKTTLRNLHQRGLMLSEMRTCLGSDFAL
jgi:hypothetical protein